MGLRTFQRQPFFLTETHQMSHYSKKSRCSSPETVNTYTCTHDNRLYK